MNVFLWILQVVLAAMFTMAGVLKTTQSREKLLPSMPWVEDLATPTVRFIGTVELLAAVGVILPAALDVAPVLTPLAATGLALLMVLAAATHLRRREPSAIGINAVAFLIAVVVAWGRFGPYSF